MESRDQKGGSKDVWTAQLLGFLRSFVTFSGSGSALPESRQRRVTLRVDCNTVVRCRRGEMSFAARVQDLNVTGLKITILSGLRPGSRLTVTGEHGEWGEALEAQVVWCHPCGEGNRFEAGLRFLAPANVSAGSWLMANLARKGLPGSDAEVRDHYRAPVFAGTLVGIDSSSGPMETPGSLINLSRTGALVDTRSMFPVNTHLTVSIPCGNSRRVLLGGRVVHRTPGRGGWRTGIVFEESTSADLDEVERLVDRFLHSKKPAAA